MSPTDAIIIRGAHEHNLKHIDLVLPRNRLIVITGLSGSGKSSLAFDTLYAEGQRRYVESLSAYARQFLERLEKPDVESIEGLSPAIAIEQRGAGGNPRSTVATHTEIYDYLRVLFARAGQPHCPRCHLAISRQSAQEIVAQILAQPTRRQLTILAPLVRGRKGEHAEALRDAKQQGFVRARVDRAIRELDEPIALDKKRAHTIEVVVDRLTVDRDDAPRLTESIETALKVGKGLVVIAGARRADWVFSELYACPRCGFSIEELSPRIFSFNSPYGACPTCDGLGTRLELDPDLVVPDRTKSLREGAIEPWKRGNLHMVMYYNRLLREVVRFYRIDPEVPFGSLPRQHQRALLYGSNDEIWGDVWEGVIPNLERRFRQTSSDYVKEEIAKRMSVLPCPTCRGTRLKEASRAVLIDGRSIADLTTRSVTDAAAWCERQTFPSAQQAIAQPLLKEIRARLQFLIDVGLGYLTLDRPSASLSGGEAQRIRLATQVGSGLVGVLYILDEPSIGLHQRDNEKLLDTLLRLRDLGNTVVVVEHDEATIRRADYLVDLGPGAGPQGGELVACGTLEDVLRAPRSLTGQFLGGTRWIPVPTARRPHAKRPTLIIRGAREHNLKGIDVSIPLGCFVCVTGVSGSGKSTLVDEILYRALARRFYGSRDKPGAHDGLTGIEHIDKVIVIDQSPIGRTPRSNPATYTDTFGPIRELFSRTPEARLRGFKPGRFSFNVKGGRCEACQGDGIKRIEMHFLPDVYVHCEVCKGRRFNDRTLQVTYKGRSIADVLAMTIDEALELFGPVPAIAEKLRTIQAVGLGYLELGQSATTLSGGEAQRIKLSKELSKRATGRTLYLLDEPTTGLHFADVDKLLTVLHHLVDQGNTVLVVEHNLEVVKTADYLIDLGPEGGAAGGELVAAGSPEEVARHSRSHTGRFLAPLLQGPRGSLSAALGRVASLAALGALLLVAGPTATWGRAVDGRWQSTAPAPNDQRPDAANSSLATYRAIERAFLREDHHAVVDLSQMWLADAPTSAQTFQTELWLGLSLDQLGQPEVALRTLERLAGRLRPAEPLWQDAVFWIGDIGQRAGKAMPAKLAWTRLLEQAPDSTWAPRAQLGLGLLYLNERAFRPALEQFRAVALTTPDPAFVFEANLLEGACLLQLGRHAQAMDVFLLVLNRVKNPEQMARASCALGQALSGLRRHEEAIEAYRRAMRLRARPDIAEPALFGIGWAQFHLRRCRESVATFTRYQQLPEVRHAAEALFAQGSCLAELGQDDEAASLLARVASGGPSRALAFESGLLLADLYRQRGDGERAAGVLERLLAQATDDTTRIQLHVRLAGIRLDQGDAASSRLHLMAATQNEELENQQEALNSLGDLLFDLGEYHDAGRRYQRVLQLSDLGPAANHAAYQLGRLQLTLGAPAAALEMFRRLAVRADGPLADDTRLAIAFAQMAGGESQAARRELEVMRKTQRGVLRARAAYYLALLAVQDGHEAEARRLCQEASAGGGRSEEALEAQLLWAQLEAARGGSGRAMARLQNLFAAGGTSMRHRARVARQLGDFARQQGDYTQAIRWYERAAELSAGHTGEILYRIASCYEQGGDAALAIARYRAISESAWEVRGRLAAAKLLERQGAWEAAEAIYEALANESVPEAKVAQEHLVFLRGESTASGLQPGAP